MSLPPAVSWRYDWTPAPGSPEAKLYTDFLGRATGSRKSSAVRCGSQAAGLGLKRSTANTTQSTARDASTCLMLCPLRPTAS